MAIMKISDFKDVSNEKFVENAKKIIEQDGSCRGIDCDYSKNICPFHYSNAVNNLSCYYNRYRCDVENDDVLLQSAKEYLQLLNQNYNTTVNVVGLSKTVLRLNNLVDSLKRLEECVKFINEDENLKRLNIEIEVNVCEQTKEL